MCAFCTALSSLQGNHYRRFWHPDQQEPFGRQQPPAHNPQQVQADLLPVLLQQQSMTMQLLQQQQQQYHNQQQQQQDNPGQAQLVTMLQQQQQMIQSLMEQQQQQQQQYQQQQQQQWGVPLQHEGIWGDAGQQRMGPDPLADLIQPTINSNPHLAAAVGARGLAGGAAGRGSHNPAAALVELISDRVDQAVREAFANHGCSGAAHGGPVEAGAATSAQPGPERVGGQAAVVTAASAPPKVREVSKLSSWQSLPQMIIWFMEVSCGGMGVWM